MPPPRPAASATLSPSAAPLTRPPALLLASLTPCLPACLQLAKEGLSRVVVDDNAANESRTFSRDELRALFQVNPSALCDTHDAIKCGCDGSGGGGGQGGLVSSGACIACTALHCVQALPCCFES
jgi:hypothetical protein